MLRRLILLVTALSLAALAAAQTAQIQVDGAQHLATFTRDGLPTDFTTDVKHTDGPVTTVTLPSSGTLYVWNVDSGNIASKPVGGVGKSWHIAENEFNRISLVSVRVEYNGEPVAAARVVLKDKARAQSQTLDAAAKGEVDFYLIQPGTASVTVEYRSEGAQAQPVTQQFSLELKRKTPNPLLKVALPNEVETIKSASATAQPSTPTAETPRRRSNPAGSILTFVVTLILAAGVGYGFYYLAKKKQDWVKDKMKQIGVDVPEPPVVAQDDSAPVPDLVPAKPQPQSKIILDDGGLPPAPVAAAVQTITHETRLVRSNGQVVDLAEGESIVGREANLGLSLVGEDSVSRRHASITRSDSQIIVKDLGSTNGTYVNGRKIQGETTLSVGDDVQFGAVKFRVESR